MSQTPNFASLSHSDYITLHPKLELHAHISGSINETHLISLIQQHWSDPIEYQEKLSICKLLPNNHYDTRNLDECFALFKVLHHIIDSKEIIHMVTLQVLEDFIFRDHAVYVELRTTPRPIRDNNNNIIITMEEYMTVVCNAIIEFRMIMVYLAKKYHIETILDQNGVFIEYYDDINKYSEYAQTIISRFDSYFNLDLLPTATISSTSTVTNTSSIASIETNNLQDHTQQSLSTLSITTTESTLATNSIPIPLTSPLSPSIVDNFNTLHQTQTISCQLPHYHHHKYSLMSIALSISSFVSCGILFSIDRASFTIEDGNKLLQHIQYLRTIDHFNHTNINYNTNQLQQEQSQEQSQQQSTQQQSQQQPQQPILKFNSYHECIVGLDFSGNPFAKNQFNYFQSIWDQLDEIGLYSSIHFAETKNETDSWSILTYEPYRLGHAALLDKHMIEKIFQNVNKKSTTHSFVTFLQQSTLSTSIPSIMTSIVDTMNIRPKMGLEICLSSNKACKLATSINVHPIISWLNYNSNIINQFFKTTTDEIQSIIIKNNNNQTIFPSISQFPQLKQQLLPITLCTDDSGVFSASLVDEWLQLLQLSYFNYQLEQQPQSNHDETSTTTTQLSPNGLYTYPIHTLQDTNMESFHIENNNQYINGEIVQRTKCDDFIRINNFAQTGIQSIFQKQYIGIIEQVMNQFRPM